MCILKKRKADIILILFIYVMNYCVFWEKERRRYSLFFFSLSYSLSIHHHPHHILFLSPQTATMTSAPKKKRDFYNGSQGLNFRDFRSPEPQEAREHTHPEPPHQLNGMRGSDSYPLLSLSPSQNANNYSSPEYSLTSPFPTRPSHIPYSQPEEDRCRPLPPGINFQSKGADFDDSISVGEDPRAYGVCSSTEQSSWAGAGMGAGPSHASTSGEDGENDGRKKKILKRKQR